MTCLFQSQTINSSGAVDVIDFRAFATVDNSPVFQLPDYDSCFDNSSHGYDLGWNGQSSTQMDLQLTIGDDFFFEDFHSPSYGGGHVASSTSPSPSQCSSSPGNTTTTTTTTSSSRSSIGGSGHEEWSAGAEDERQSKCSVREDKKVCGVCGDKALGFNFDAISCESCKAFFRRNAPKGIGYFKCPYDEKCKMDASNRRFCKRCRLKKCLRIGMKKEYILTDEEKATKRRKIEENRHLKKTTMTTTNNSSSNDNNRSTTDTVSTTATAAMPFEQISPSFEESIFQMTSDWQTMEEEAQWKPAQQQQPLPQPSSSCDWTQAIGLRPLNADSASAIADLRASYRNSLDVDVETPQQSSSNEQRKSLKDLVNIAELSVRRVIAMVKQVTSFRRLPQVEQIHLLKGGSIDLLIIRSVITFDEQKQHFLDPFDNEGTRALSLSHLQTAEVGLGLFDAHMRFIRSLASEGLRADETTLILLLVISLFSPDRENLTWKEFVSTEQEKYSMLLKEYLESIHPLPVARRLFPKLLMKLTDVRNLNEDHSQVLLKMRPEGIHPLMKEVLDLTT